MGSPTNERAQCRTLKASERRSDCTPGTPCIPHEINLKNRRVDVQGCMSFLRSHLHLIYHIPMQLNSLLDNVRWFVCFPSPFGTNRIFVMSPAKDAFISTCQRRSCFHALVTGDA